jgi:hypothetical protein
VFAYDTVAIGDDAARQVADRAENFVVGEHRDRAVAIVECAHAVGNADEAIGRAVRLDPDRVTDRSDRGERNVGFSGEQVGVGGGGRSDRHIVLLCVCAQAELFAACVAPMTQQRRLGYRTAGSVAVL